ncbi:hypothetical protein VTK73DRAFT_7440 [Phialemonium thermophilum]|uniref:Translin n=1 Tax=Phialemonium thermophilum TaxID=223376 RepID=A0ABR3WEI8_9PEZI
MSGFKRDRSGNTKRRHDAPRQAAASQPAVRSAYTPMFEHFRDELDEHHDRRERLVKASRDITALSKKIIFSLQRVRKIESELPSDITKETEARLDEISRLLATVAGETQGIHRHRYAYSLRCLEELVEALTFAHYLKTQSLISPGDLASITDELCRRGAAALARGEDEAMPDATDAPKDAHVDAAAAPSPAERSAAEDPPTVPLTEEDYLHGVFDLSGEMMRFATTTTALTGRLASAAAVADPTDPTDRTSQPRPRTIVQDMQDLRSFFEMLPPQRSKTWSIKMDVLRTSVAKVERLGYGITVRGSEREKGWVPDMADDEGPEAPE